MDEQNPQLRQFENWLMSNYKLTQSTVDLYLGMVGRFTAQVGETPEASKVYEYLAAVRKSGVSYSYIKMIITAIERFLTFLGHPLTLSRPPKPGKLIPSCLTEAEIAVLLHAVPTLREKAMISVLVYSGIRNRELCQLTIGDVDIPNGTIHVRHGKGNRERLVCISGGCATILAEYLLSRRGKDEDLLFLTLRRELPLEQQDVRKVVRVAAARVGFDKRIYPHLMRHSLATNMLHRGANLLAIKEQLGHAHLQSTMAYLHSSKEWLKAEYVKFSPSYL